MEIQLNLGFSHDEFLELLEILSDDFSPLLPMLCWHMLIGVECSALYPREL